MTQHKVNNKTHCRVLVFNPLKRLVAIYQSVTATARSFNVTSASIYMSCTGQIISCCNLYFRYLPDNIEITLEDLGMLKLEDYDQLCGVTRKYYKTKDMTPHKGMKYKKQ